MTEATSRRPWPARGHRQQDRLSDACADYSSVQVSRQDLLGNSRRADAFELRRQLAKDRQAVDKKEWTMTPPTVNAYYQPLHERINFPAGILQPPFFDRSMDDAVTTAASRRDRPRADHGFDDQGRKFDGTGT